MMQSFETIDDYIASFPGETQEILKEIKQTIKEAAPDTTEAMSYKMPTFKLNGKNLVHFAAFKNHIGFFPTPSGIDGLIEEAKKYRSGKGTMQFPFDEPIPFDLIKRIVKYRVNETKKK